VKHEERLTAFLNKTVNLNRSRLDDLDSRVTAIMNCLRKDATLGPLVKTHIRQGSWAHRTIIKPLPDDEFDADILLHLTPVKEWSKSPRSYIDQVYRALKNSVTYRDMVEKKNRCVRIHYANDCHVDVVPYLVLGFFENRKVIVNHDTNTFERTDPEAFTSWMRRQDRRAGNHLRTVTRLMKYLRDRQDAFSVPSVILATLIGRQVSTWWVFWDGYKDLPTTFMRLISSLDSYLQQHEDMPEVSDPGHPDVTFNHRWDERRYAHFRSEIQKIAAQVRAAHAETDQTQSILLWQKVFGPAF
jgi:Second Messenger Oligonucleotide or Dinucleotide Synthetase domain